MGETMAEPVTLYKNDDKLTVNAPSEVKRLIADGWSLDKPDPKPAAKAAPKRKPAAKGS